MVLALASVLLLALMLAAPVSHISHSVQKGKILKLESGRHHSHHYFKTSQIDLFGISVMLFAHRFLFTFYHLIRFLISGLSIENVLFKDVKTK